MNNIGTKNGDGDDVREDSLEGDVDWKERLEGRLGFYDSIWGWVKLGLTRCVYSRERFPLAVVTNSAAH